ncbi:hypothetical protein FDX11_15635 [Citrobacter sp. wls714]|nr:hypothetical protein FDX11_15635 [Citrobacter sp. wls714]
MSVRVFLQFLLLAQYYSRFSRISVLRTSTFFGDTWPVVFSSIYFLNEIMYYKNNIHSENYVLAREYSFFKPHSIPSY